MAPPDEKQPPACPRGLLSLSRSPKSTSLDLSATRRWCIPGIDLEPFMEPEEHDEVLAREIEDGVLDNETGTVPLFLRPGEYTAEIDLALFQDSGFVCPLDKCPSSCGAEDDDIYPACRDEVFRKVERRLREFARAFWEAADRRDAVIAKNKTDADRINEWKRLRALTYLQPKHEMAVLRDAVKNGFELSAHNRDFWAWYERVEPYIEELLADALSITPKRHDWLGNAYEPEALTDEIDDLTFTIATGFVPVARTTAAWMAFCAAAVA